jgi:hypothetical protein
LQPKIVTEEPFKTIWLKTLDEAGTYGRVQKAEGESSSGCHWQATLQSGDRVGAGGIDDDAAPQGQLPVYMEARRGKEVPVRATKSTDGNESLGLAAVKVKSMAAATTTMPDDGDADADAASGDAQHAVSCAIQGVRSTRISWAVRGKGGLLLLLPCRRVKNAGVRDTLRQGVGYEWRTTEMKETRSRPVSMNVTVPVSSATAAPSPKEKNTELCPWSGI